jgi:hypothetical protein
MVNVFKAAHDPVPWNTIVGNEGPPEANAVASEARTGRTAVEPLK